MPDNEHEPDVTITPVEADNDPEDVYQDPEMGDMTDAPPESFQADIEDIDGADDKP